MEIDKTEKKQEFKDWSLNSDILINELSEDEVVHLFPAPKTVSFYSLISDEVNNLIF